MSLPQPRAGRMVLLACLAVCAGLVLSACGTTDASLQRTLFASRNPTLQLLDRQDVLRQPAGSPQRVLMEAWRALQFQDGRLLLSRLTGPPVRPRPDLDATVIGFDGYVRDTRPRVLATRITGRRARMRVELSRDERVGSDSIFVRRVRITLAFARRGSGWRIVLNAPQLQRLVKVAQRR